MLRHVLIVSFDGGKPSAIRQSPMPNLLWLAAHGSCTWTARTIVPSITLPSHASMLTGVGPETHKITWNDYQPAKGVVAVPTVFALAKKAGLTTAMFAGKEKFAHLNVPGTLDACSAPSAEAIAVASAAAQCLTTLRPSLTFVHFSDPDAAGHKYGWGSPEQVEAFGRSDRALGILLAALKRAGIHRETALILSADHGGHGKTHGLNAPSDVLIPWIAYGSGIRHRKLIGPVYTCDTAATALALLGIAVPADWDGAPVREALR